MTTFIFHGNEAIDPTEVYGPLQVEFGRRGFPSRIIRSRRRRTRTPNRDRARILLEALRDEMDDIALIGISNEGLFMPLVAAARPIRRIVMLNAVMPFPGQSFWQATKNEQVWANWATRLLARIAPGMSEVCPLSELPQTEYVYVCGADDDAINPAWEQCAAREYLHVDPIVIPGAKHSDIVYFVRQVVDAATRGLTPTNPPLPGPAPEPLDLPPGAASSPIQPDVAAGTSRQQLGNPFRRAVSLLVIGLVPVLSYFLIRPHVASDVAALAIAWFIPVLWTLVSSLWQRRLNVLGMLGVAAYGTALVISIYTGAGSLPLKLHHAVVAGLVGLVFLGSAAIGRPILLIIARRVAGNTRQQSSISRRIDAPGVRQSMTRLTLYIGIVALVDALLQAALAVSLPTSSFLVATTVVHISVVAFAVAVALLVILLRLRSTV
jgi:hypothetical protein